MTIRHTDESTEIVVEALLPEPWGRLRPAICTALGLPDDAVLYYGVGPAEDNWLLGTAPLLAGCELTTEPAAAVRDHAAVELAILSGPDAGAAIPVRTERIVIGRGAGCTLRLTDPAVSHRHVELIPGASGLEVRDLGSTNGVFVDGRAVTGTALAQTGTFIRIGASVMQVQLGIAAGGSRQFLPDGLGHLVRVAGPQTGASPQLRIPPRPTAPMARSRRGIPVASALIGAVAGAGLALFTHNLLFLAFTALGPITMIGGAVLDRLRGRRSLGRQRAAYRSASGEWQRQVDIAVSAFRREVWGAYPGPRELLRRARGPGAGLWSSPHPVVSAGVTSVSVITERADEGGTVGDGAVGGKGVVSDAVRGDAVRGRRFARGTVASNVIEDNAVEDPRERDQPIVVADLPRLLAPGGVWGAVGPRGRAAGRWLLAQLICARSPSDLAILLVDPGRDLAMAQDLPHVVPDATADGRDLMIVIDGGATDYTADRAALPPGAVTVAPDTGASEAASGRSVTVLHLVDDDSALPSGAARLGPDAELTGIGAEVFAQLCRAILPLRDRSASTALPQAVNLVAVTGRLDADTVAQRWRQPTARALLGVGTGGPVALDLDADGPHLLIAGTTGAGKSELLQSLITTLAVAAPPEATTMLLVDYKGGAAFGDLAELPHVVGMLTDLDPALSARALTSLRAELHRREKLAAAGQSAERLIIVIDEFATLAVELPEFLAGVLDIAQRGRSLGVHLILATQRPAGVVSPAMRANISARICLRVTDAGDSADVIGTAEAAGISPRTPGRAVLATGSGRTLFQTALATAPTPPALRIRVRDNGAHPAEAQPGKGQPGEGRSVEAQPGVENPGAAPSREAQPACATRGRAIPSPSVVQTVVALTRQLHGNAPAPHAPWAPPLPQRIDAQPDDPPDLFAVKDLPQEQCQVTIAAPGEPVLVVGPPRSGRTTALRRLAAAAAHRGAEILVIDGGGDLADLAALPQVSTYLRRTDGRLMLRALTLLTSRESDHIRYLVIDHLDAVAADIEALDYTSGASLLTEVTGSGTVRLIAGGPVSLGHGRHATNIPTIVELSGASRPGRGTLGGAEIQIVDCRTGTVSPPRIRRRPHSTIVRPLPDRVTAAELPPPHPHRLPIGIGGDSAAPLTLDLTGAGGAIVVTGPRRAGTSTALATVAIQSAAAGVDVWWLSTTGRPAPAGRAVDLRNGTEPLRAALSTATGPLLLVADDAGADHPAADLLDRFLAHCGPGQYLLLGERLDGLARARRGHLAAALGHRRGLLLSPDATDGPILDIRVPRRIGPVLPGRGLWVDHGCAQPVQVALPEERAL